MKIFGKRKKKVQKEAAPAPAHSSDAVVEELLKLDPSKLNAKQRRMIKRYQERSTDGTGKINAETKETAEKGITPSETRNNKNEQTEETTEPEKQPQEKEPEKDASDSEDDDSNSTDDEEESSEWEGDDEDTSLPTVQEKGAKDKTTEAHSKDKEDDNISNEKKSEAAKDSENDQQHDNSERQKVIQLIQGLNSKQRRKLMRQLERDGDDGLEQIREEAMSLANKKEAFPSDKPATEAKQPSKQESGKKRKKDWSSLPPEERMRREEQRRLQKEAAERRAKEPVGQKRHPLNSERRRANRRKPKWSRKTSVPSNEHDTSGYHMRKIQKTSY